MPNKTYIIEQNTKMTKFGRYLNPAITRDWKKDILTELKNQTPMRPDQLKKSYQLDINDLNKASVKMRIKSSKKINTLGIGYSAKAAYENGIKEIRSQLEQQHIKLHSHLNNFQAYLWNDFYHPDKIKLLIVSTTNNDIIYVIYNQL